MKTMKRRWEKINCEGGTQAPHWEAQVAVQRAICRAAKTTVYSRARHNVKIPSFQTRIQKTMGMWRVTAKSLTEENRWSSAHRAASGSTSPVPRWSAPPSQTSGTAPSARQKVQKEEQKLEREQKRGRITASSARRLQVSRRSHNKERRQITYNWLLEVFSWGWCACRNIRPPVSWAPSIHLSHPPPPTFHIRVQSHLTHEAFSLLKLPYFLAPHKSHSLLSVYQIINVSRLTSGKSRKIKHRIGEYHCTNSDLYEFKCDKVSIPGTIRVRNSW